MNTIEIYKRCQEGLKFLWANRLDDAEKFFSTEKETNARYALHYTEVSLYRTIITGYFLFLFSKKILNIPKNLFFFSINRIS